MATFLNQIVNHVNQRRIISFEIGGKQSQNTVVGNFSINPFEGL